MTSPESMRARIDSLELIDRRSGVNVMYHSVMPFGRFIAQNQNRRPAEANGGIVMC